MRVALLVLISSTFPLIASKKAGCSRGGSAGISLCASDKLLGSSVLRPRTD